MEASKLTISGETLRAHIATLSKARKTELRREAIMAYIRNKPAGSIMKTSAFMAVGAFNTEANAHAVLQRMVRDGLIGRMHAEGSKRFYTYWVIESPVSTEKTEDTPMPIEDEERQPETPTDVPLPESAEDYAPKTETIDYDKIRHNVSLSIAAKDFAWKNNSDSLRAFIDWYVR